MLSLSQCKCQCDTSRYSLCQTLTQCRNTHNNGNERRNMAMQMSRIKSNTKVSPCLMVLLRAHIRSCQKHNICGILGYIYHVVDNPSSRSPEITKTVYYFSLLSHLPPPKTSITPPLKILDLFSLLPHVDQSRS